MTGSLTAFFFVLALLIGVAAGAILGLNGFAQPAGTTALSQTPRIKNLGWLLSGFFLMYIADPKRLHLPDDFPFYWLFIGYGLGAVVGVTASVGWMARSITTSVRSFNNQHPLGPLDSGRFIREYLTYGKARYEELYARETTKAEELEKTRKREIETSEGTTDCVYKVMREFRSRRYPPEPETMDAILKAICDKAAVAKNKTISLSGSYMAFIPKDQADDNLIRKASFTEGMPGRYSGYLVLKRGSVRISREIVLPIAVIPDEVLPGSPEAVLTQSFTQNFSVINIRNIKFRPGVVPQVQKEVIEYYKHPYFDQVASVTSILVHDKQSLFGVMNIESTATNMFGEEVDKIKLMIESLQPFVALLSAFR